MTKSGQTTDYKVSDHLADLKKYLGREADYIIINNGPIPEEISKWYLEHNEKPVYDDIDGQFSGVKIRKDIIDRNEIKKSSADKLFRSVLRHDSDKLAKTISEIL